MLFDFQGCGGRIDHIAVLICNYTAVLVAVSGSGNRYAQRCGFITGDCASLHFEIATTGGILNKSSS